MPGWAQTPHLQKTLEFQEAVDPQDIFGRSVQSISLSGKEERNDILNLEIFKEKK